MSSCPQLQNIGVSRLPNGVGLITYSRPEIANAINPDVLQVSGPDAHANLTTAAVPRGYN